MNKWEKEVAQHQLAAEEAVIKELEAQYKRALKEINLKIRILQSDELTQSKIYQINYQEALKGQIEGILEKLHGDEYTSIQQYLKECYTDGFIGTMYDIAGQGIPLMIPIDQNAAVKAIMTDSKINEGLYKAIGVDTAELKKRIRSEITRGLAANDTYESIAQSISLFTNAPLKRARTIVRTEGHRIQQASTEDARQAAKKRGCDILKVWDATLDGDTRPTHRKLDGQIRETDEFFEMDGKKAKYPGEFGRPEEDCNCRCTANSIPRWALDEAELEEQKERAKYFGIDKTKDFEEYKEKYLKAAENVEKSGNLRYNSGGLMGAYNDENDPYNEKREAHANLYYEEIRNSSKKHFVDAVSKNSSIDAETVEKVYLHVFSNKHMLDNTMKYFDPDYYMAESFRRLRTNSNIQEHDKVLLRHEALEYDLMQENPDMTYEEAHGIAEKAHNYKKALLSWLKKEGK